MNIDVERSLAAVDAGEHVTQYRGLQMLKFPADLHRYGRLISYTRPALIIETGSHTGASARWFADQFGVEFVISVDIAPEPPLAVGMSDRIVWLTGASSTDPSTVERAAAMALGRRTMVVLDSYHGVEHVEREIEAYGPLVSQGCALVVEDGLFDLATPEQLASYGMPTLVDGGPLAAIRSHLVPELHWLPVPHGLLDVGSPLTQNVEGWWVRV